MISTIHGHLPLVIYPAEELDVSAAGRTRVCTVRGEALGQRINAQITLDVNSGELLIMSPDKFVGSFRLGDLIAAHMQMQVTNVMRDRERLEGVHAQTH